MQESTISDIDFSDFSSFFFKVNHIFMEEKDNSLEKVVMCVAKLDGIETDDI